MIFLFLTWSFPPCLALSKWLEGWQKALTFKFYTKWLDYFLLNITLQHTFTKSSFDLKYLLVLYNHYFNFLIFSQCYKMNIYMYYIFIIQVILVFICDIVVD